MAVLYPVKQTCFKELFIYLNIDLNVDIEKDYGRAFSKGMFTICVTVFISGIIALFGENGAIVSACLIVLFVGLIVAFVILAKVQKKYNGGFF